MRESPKTEEYRQEPRANRRRIRIAIGWSFVVLGIVGLFLPFLQGILFIAIGLLILAEYSKWAGSLLKWVAERYPAGGSALEGARDSVKRVTVALERAAHNRWLLFGIFVAIAAIVCFFWLT